MTEDAPRSDGSRLTPPVAERRPSVIEAHGDEREDDFAWLRDREDPRVVEHLTAENAYTEAATAHLDGLKDLLFEEIKSRIEETDLSVPVRKGPWWYLTRTVEGLAYPIHSRVPLEGPGREPGVPPMPDAVRAETPERWPDEQVLIDENELAQGHDYLAIGVFDVSPGHDLLAYATDTTGGERFSLRFKDLTTGEHLGDEIPEVSYGSAWANDNTTFLYQRADATNRPYQIWTHRLGTDVSSDTLMHEEPDERFFLELRRTKDGKLIVASSHSHLSSEVSIASADDPSDGFSVVEERRDEIEYDIDHHHGFLIMVSNEDAPNFKMLASRVDERSWFEVIPHRSDVRLEGIDVFDDFLACAERTDAMPRIRVHALAGDLSTPIDEGWLVPVDEVPSTSSIGPNPESSSRMLRYEYSSLITPRTVLDLDLTSRESVVRKRQPVLGGYDPAQYVSERLWATAEDGTLVPISLVKHKDTPTDGSAPGVVYGYGAYEASIDPTFSSIRLSLLDRGFVYAIAHIRGGGEMGRRWYDDGKMLKKRNTFTDFIACTRYLIAENWMSPDRIAARGASAGGLLMGAVTNMAPDLFKAIDAHVPFVDVLTTMLDATIPLTVTEWEEWGNPVESTEVYFEMKSYSPYDNVKDGVRYPDIYATGGLSDPRVGYWEPAKWVQRLRAASPESRVLLKMEMGAGHGGPSGRYDSWKQEALALSAILDSLGLA
ncbi:MAG: S9 family peptidase [Acidimicrobiales bacterium]